MTVLETEIANIVSAHQGRENAITYKQIAADVGQSRRVVRDVTKRLIEVHGLPIGSISDRDGGGYFMIMNEEERTHSMRELISRIESLTNRVSSLSKAQLQREEVAA